MSNSNINSSALINDHQIGTFGNYYNKEKSELLTVKELTNLSIYQIAKFKSSKANVDSVTIDGLNLPKKYPDVSYNIDTRILWNGPDICMVVSTDIDIKEKLSSINSDDFAVTDLSHSRAGIEISGLHAIDVLKKGTPLNLNNSEFTKDNCANSSYNGISFMLDFIDDQPLTFRLFCLRSFGGSFYHSITDSALEYGFIGE